MGKLTADWGQESNPPLLQPLGKVFRAVREMCDGCRICEMVCSLRFTGTVNPYHARIRVIRTENSGNYPIICRHCKNPPCELACPVPEAMILDERTGIVTINDSECIRCLACVDACPFGAIQVGAGKEVLKCDLCGGDPVCVQHCPSREPPPRFTWPRQSCLQKVEPHQLVMAKKSRLP